MRRVPAGNDYNGWVAQLGRSQRRQQARGLLMAAGQPAVPAVRGGLEHPNPIVRRMCVNILDHLVDDESVPALVAALDDDDPAVVARALHALACDQCKENACRPGEELFVPRAIEILHTHANPDLRAAAIDTLGKVRRRPDAAAALATAAEREPNSGLRNMARRLRASRSPRDVAVEVVADVDHQLT